jgi:hypothetical protein
MKNDLAGERFARLTVVMMVSRKQNDSYWLCECRCGALATVRANNLKTGNTKSCGCLRREMLHRGLNTRKPLRARSSSGGDRHEEVPVCPGRRVIA